MSKNNPHHFFTNFLYFSSFFVLFFLPPFSSSHSGTIMEVPVYHKGDIKGAGPAIDFSALDKLNNILNERQKELFPDYIEAAWEKRKKEWGKIRLSPPKLKILKKFSLIESVAGSSIFRVPENLTVYVHALPDKLNFFYLLTPEDGMKYRVSADRLEDLEDIINLKNIPLTHKEYYVPQTANSFRNSLSLSTALNFHYESDLHPFYENALEKSGLSGRSFRFENMTFIKGHLPLEFGAVFGYQEGNTKEDEDNLYSWINYYLGPMFRFPLLDVGQNRLKFHFGYLLSLKYEMVLLSNHRPYNLISRALEIGTDLLLGPSSNGVVMGLVFRQEWIRPRDGDDFFNNKNNHGQLPNTSIGVSLGYRWGKDL